ncbi:MAG: hypothetical protein WCE36_13425, partial [Pseudolabrys sp.]
RRALRLGYDRRGKGISPYFLQKVWPRFASIRANQRVDTGGIFCVGCPTRQSGQDFSAVCAV